jgi:hypothetical protein
MKPEFLTIPKEQILIALRDAGIIDAQRDTSVPVIPTTPDKPPRSIEKPEHKANIKNLRRMRPARKR